MKEKSKIEVKLRVLEEKEQQRQEMIKEANYFRDLTLEKYVKKNTTELGRREERGERIKR